MNDPPPRGPEGASPGDGRDDAAAVVTFLFTDIEGSTRLWEHHPAEMGVALARHDALMRQAIERSGGVVFKTIGDAFCAVFPKAEGALDAAIAAQRAIMREPWPAPVAIRVRMAMHTEAAEARDGDYFGPALNRVARLLSAGHGGQVLLTAATRDAALATLPADVGLRDLGERQLRHLIRTERVYQVVSPGLGEAFPPLVTPDARSHNLPMMTTSFVGRDDERAALQALTDDHRLVTLTGPGGTGKTRLALQVATERVDRFMDGARFVDLAPLADAQLVPQTVAAVLGVQEQPGVPLDEALVKWLAGKELLLVLDNCEHVLAGVAPLCQRLLAGSRGVRLMATSREALHVPGEHVFRVPSLTVPDADATGESILRSASARLFVDRAVAVRPSFRLADGDDAILASLCRRLDGIPLALELAAARVHAMSLAELHARLDQRLRLLTGGARTALPRQQTLRSTIDWSYELLGEAERALLRRLAVFAGGWTLAAAEAVCESGRVEEGAVLDLLSSLVDKSLVHAESGASVTRYRFLETVRHYALDRLRASEDDAAVHERHFAWCLAMAELAFEQRGSPGEQERAAALELEHENVRAAFAWQAATGRDAARGLRLAIAMRWLWQVRGHVVEARARLTETFDRAVAANVDASLIARASNALGAIAHSLGDHAGSRAHYERAHDLYLRAGNRRGIAVASNGLATVAATTGAVDEALAWFGQTIAMDRELGDSMSLATSLRNLALFDCNRGDFAAARPLAEESLALQRQLGGSYGIADSLEVVAIALRGLGDREGGRRLTDESLRMRRAYGDRLGIAAGALELARMSIEDGETDLGRRLAEEALAIARVQGFGWAVVEAQHALGLVAEREGDVERALRLQRESLRAAKADANRSGMAAALEAIASLAIERGEGEMAVLAWACARQLRQSLGLSLPASSLARAEAAARAARAGLTDATAFETTWDRGRDALPDDVAAMVLARGDAAREIVREGNVADPPVPEASRSR